MTLSSWVKRNDFDLYKDEFKHTKLVSRNNFIHEQERINPLSSRYVSYWKTFKRRCVEGYWFEGKWMPGNLYHYINVSKILLNKDKKAKTKSLGRPKLRDLEWEKAYVLMEARGFSGFTEDNEYTCKLEVKQIIEEKDPVQKALIFKDFLDYGFITDSCFKGRGREIKDLKKFICARFYLRLIHSRNLGKPIFENNSSNVIDIEARRLGKSYWAANGIAIPNFIYDGATDYDVYLEALKNKEPLSSETLVGAIEAKYSNDLCEKILSALDQLKDGFDGQPHPFHKQVKGSLEPADFLMSIFDEKKDDSQWIKKGTKSKIHNRTFKGKPTAGNGTGSNIILLEEVGFMDNLIESLSALKDATYEGTSKFGTVYGFGTSGEMESGKSGDARMVFENPEQFDCLSFDNIWEESGSIGFFVPYIYRLDSFSDSEGNINKEKSEKFAEEKREKIIKNGNAVTINKERQNNPLKPSEAFMSSNNNDFPVAELRSHLAYVKVKNANGEWLPENGELSFELNEEDEMGVAWNPDLEGKLNPCWYGMKPEDNKKGCIQIYEHPVYAQDGGVPGGLYLAGNDPYDQDNATTSSSLGSTFIYKKFYNDMGVSHEVVAEYTARPNRAKDHHENVRKLLLYYNARLLYENEKITLKVHFEQKSSLYLLAKKPNVLKSAEESNVDRTYGVHMSTPIKKDCLIMLNDWLREEREDGKLNLHSIKSVPLLEELINYNDTGNFDRIIAIMLTIVNLNQQYNVNPNESNEKKVVDSFIGKMLKQGLYND
jgi:hypothetical protein